MRFIRETFRRRSPSTGGHVVVKSILAILLASGSTTAQDASIGARVGTAGLGLEATLRIVDPIGVRAGFNTLSVDFEGAADDIDYDFTIDLRSTSLLMDLYLSRAGFRITGGMLLNGNELNMVSDFEGEIDIGDSTYTAAEVGVLSGVMDFANAAPFVGFGIDSSLGKRRGLGFLFEIGLLFQGSPGVDLAADGPIRDDPAFLVELRKEEDSAEDDLRFFKVYPVLALGITYKFWQGKLTSGDR